MNVYKKNGQSKNGIKKNTKAQTSNPNFTKKSEKVKNVKQNELKPTLPKTKRLKEISLSLEQGEMLSSIPQIAFKSFQLSKKHLKALNKNVFLLFEQLTKKRTERNINYLNYDASLVAYSYYYLPWNCYKLVKLFLSLKLDGAFLKTTGTLKLADFGAGPLTVLISLWIAYPELRKKNIEFSCFDISNKAMEKGEEIFRNLASKFGIASDSWKIKKTKAQFFTDVKENFDFYFSSNLFNEFLDSKNDFFSKESYKVASRIVSLLTEKGSALIIEPGTPHGSDIITSLRLNFLQKGLNIIAPCTHCKNCPLNFKLAGENKVFEKFVYAKKKWCHFSFSTNEVPTALVELSNEVGLPKEDVAFSYLALTKEIVQNHKSTKKSTTVRIISDAILLKDNFVGFYACSEYGFVLLSSNTQKLKDVVKGKKLKLDSKLFTNFKTDRKTGAILINLV